MSLTLYAYLINRGCEAVPLNRVCEANPVKLKFPAFQTEAAKQSSQVSEAHFVILRVP